MFAHIFLPAFTYKGLASTKRLAVSFTLVWLACSATAQTASQTYSLRQAVDAAWLLSSSSRAESSRRIELAAKAKAASSWMSGEPVVSVAHRTDRFNRNDGFRDYEGEMELPLWNPGVRAAAQADVAAQRNGFEVQFALNKLKLAGELRALSATTALAQVELDLNSLRLFKSSSTCARAVVALSARSSPASLSLFNAN